MDLIWGSPTSVLLIEPAFKEYHFIDLDKGNIETLEEQVNSRTQGPYDPQAVHFYNADCNDVLLSKVFPKVRYQDYVRALCLLDPYGLHLDWRVIETAGRMKSVEIFLNFPIMDINRNVLHRGPTRILSRLNVLIAIGVTIRGEPQLTVPKEIYSALKRRRRMKHSQKRFAKDLNR